MKNQNITFQQFLEKIKTIDVGELLEKAKTIKVEDFKSIKLSDLKEITKSNYFFPSIGIIFAALTSVLFFIPSIETFKEKSSRSNQFKDESNELPLISEELIFSNHNSIFRKNISSYQNGVYLFEVSSVYDNQKRIFKILKK